MRIYYPEHKGNFIMCSYLTCAHGMGLAGGGRCPGAWWMQCCPEYEEYEENEMRSWKMRVK